MLDKLKNILKITKFCGELELQDGTKLEIDGNFFNVGVTVSVQTKDGLTPLPTGSYTLNSGDIITVKDGVVKEIISPVINKPIPDPIVNRVMDESGSGPWGGGPWPHEQMLAVDPTQTGDGKTPAPASTDPQISATPAADASGTTATDVDTRLTDIETKLTDIINRLSVLEGGKPSESPTPDVQTQMTQMKADLKTLLEKTTFAKEIKTNSKLEIKDSEQSRIDLIRKITNR